ncbi:MAG: ABC transporter permease, partial [Tepidisphaeraceae bacterium]
PAAALSLLRELAHHPPRRPVLICFTGADSYDLMGTRQLLMSLADPPAKWRKAIEEALDPQLDEVRRELKTAESLHGDPTRLDPVADRELIATIVKIVKTDVAVEQDEMFALRVASRSPGMSTAEAERTRTLEDRQIRLNQIKYGFQSAPQSLNTFGDAPRQYLERAIQRLGGAAGRDGLLQQLSDRKAALQERAALYEWLADRIGRNRNPDLRDNDERLLEILIGIDLSDRGRRVGPIAWGRLYGQQSIGQVQEYREWMQRLAAPGATAAEWFAPLKGKIDFEPAKLIRSQASYLAAPLALPTELGAAWGIPALTMATLEDLRPRRDTPLDTLDRLDVPAILPQAAALHTLLTHAFDAPDFLGQPEFRRNNNEYEGQVVSTASGRPIPDLPREGFLATHYYLNADRKIPLIKSMPYALGVRRSEVRDCDSEGRYYFDGEPKVADLKKLVTKVYRIEPGTGAINASTDLGGGSSGVSTVVNLDASIDPVKSVVFNSREATIVGLYDPRYLQWLGEVQFIDARRNAEPQRFDAIVGDAMMEANLEPGSRNDVLFRYGRIGNRIVLLNLPDPKSANTPASQAHSEGRGYTVDQLNHIVPLPLVTARDFWRLNDVRIEQYRKAGVTSALIDNMHAHAADELRNAENALQSDDTAALLKATTGAWADEARVYDAAQKMANDVIYAAIFLLLLAVPFSFCMERLTIGTANIYKQIAGSCGYFGVMALALWLFHPAFKISSSPLIIILAFAIIFMSLIVIGVVYGKFDAELKRIRSGRGVGEGTRFASASVMMSAIMLGIANMRRRKFRTVLTATTVVLITFAVLCFTSSSRYQGIVALPTGVDPAYPGLLLRQRGYRPIATEAIASLHAAFPDLKFVERWWTANPSDAKDQTELVSPTAVVAVPAMLGLSPGESELSAIRDVIPNYDRLERGETNVIYLPIPIARQLKVKQGDTLSLAGRRLQVAGIYDPTAFDQRVTSLAGDSLAPLKYSTGAIDASGGRLTDSNSDTLDLDADSSAAEAGSSYEHLPATQFAIAPAKALEGLDYTSLKSIGVRVASASQSPAERDAAVKKMVEQTTQRFAMATFAGYSDGVKLVSASNLASIGGGANVMIPLAIGGLIIFNTMMGSIAERKREIHVYTSLGLAPLHVGALFVAEAMTYGLIGSVFGYIIGQGIGTALLKLGWLGNVTLNYSGTSAMLTLGLILLIVFLSALVPARLASKIAAPSIDRAWRVPAPKDNRIIADLPFTINQTAA